MSIYSHKGSKKKLKMQGVRACVARRRDGMLFAKVSTREFVTMNTSHRHSN